MQTGATTTPSFRGTPARAGVRLASSWVAMRSHSPRTPRRRWSVGLSLVVSVCVLQLLVAVCSVVVSVSARGEFCNGCTSEGDTFECPSNHICTEDCPPFKQCVCTCVRTPTPGHTNNRRTPCGEKEAELSRRRQMEPPLWERDGFRHLPVLRRCQSVTNRAQSLSLLMLARLACVSVFLAWMLVSIGIATLVVCASLLYALIQLYRGEPLFQPCRNLCCPAEDSYERISAF